MDEQTNNSSVKKKPATGLDRIIKATRYSFQGLQATVRTEAAFRQELILLAIAVVLTPWLAQTLFQAVALICSVIFILIVELINSAIEAIVDRVGTEFHELSGRAKDMGSAAVFLSLTIATLVWAAALIQKLS